MPAAPVACNQVAETSCADLEEAADEVALKLALWEGRSEFEDLVQTWSSTHLEALDMAGFEEAIARCVEVPVPGLLPVCRFAGRSPAELDHSAVSGMRCLATSSWRTLECGKP